MGKLDEILDDYKDTSERGLSDFGLKQSLKQLFLDIVGEPTWLDENFNAWIETLRRRIGEL